MADEPFKMQNQWPEQKPAIGDGEGEAPLAAPVSPKIDIRTLASDEKSMEGNKENAAPRPYSPPPVPPKKDFQAPPASEESFSFKPSQIESTPAPQPPIPIDLKKMKSKSPKKGVFVFLIIVVLIIGAGLVGYFFIYPYFFNREEPSPTPPAAVCGDGVCDIGENPNDCPSDCESLPITPVCGDGICDTEEKNENNCAIDCVQMPPPSIPATHNSLFKTPADSTQNISFLVVNSLSQVLRFETAQTPTLKEILFENDKGEPVVFELFANSLLPNIFTKELTDNFNSDATFFLYQNDRGSWPGFIARIKPEVTTANFTSDVSQKIKEGDLTSLFLTEPGTVSTWKIGQTNGLANNYLSFSKNGFAINFAWVNDELLVTTSYEAFKEALRRLQ